MSAIDEFLPLRAAAGKTRYFIEKEGDPESFTQFLVLRRVNSDGETKIHFPAHMLTEFARKWAKQIAIEHIEKVLQGNGRL